ncbi:MAG TPA: hypothetical protein VH206_19505 [Xanthobacteraceae bacterium]|jgi:hypothetical protein|nr:hypothetical protein [Xanthobacteraceae bacterium]
MNLFSLARRWMQLFREDAVAIREDIVALRADISDVKMLAAKAITRRVTSEVDAIALEAAEFRVFSQFGEDGILQYLIRRARIPRELTSFVEFGVEDYSEANTRFLLVNDNWRGLIMDAGAANMAAVRAWPLRWKYDLTIKEAFIDRDNINDLIASAGFSGPIGVLSIDIDGNDYWVWERISVIDPIIVVVEYNALFGAARAVTVPYDPTFDYARAHHSHLYWGCSLRALELLAGRKGYALVGANSAGNNAFFVRRNYLNGQPELNAAQAYRESRFRISRDSNGYFNFLPRQAQIAEIADMPLLDIEGGGMTKVRDVILDCLR